MATKNVFPMAIEIPDLEMAAYLRALIENTYPGDPRFTLSAAQKLEACFPGGLDAVRKIGFCGGDRYNIWKALDQALHRAGITMSSAPWLKTQAPKRIGGFGVEYNTTGPKAGCVQLTWDEMDAIMAKREEFKKGD